MAYELRNPKRKSRLGPVKEATRWADGQIVMLKEMGTIHTSEEWIMIRSELRKSRLNKATCGALSNDHGDRDDANAILVDPAPTDRLP